jgi:hypothetical protein
MLVRKMRLNAKLVVGTFAQVATSILKWELEADILHTNFLAVKSNETGCYHKLLQKVSFH